MQDRNDLRINKLPLPPNTQTQPLSLYSAALLSSTVARRPNANDTYAVTDTHTHSVATDSLHHQGSSSYRSLPTT